MTIIITSEQVGKGHPDKIADQISDNIYQSALNNDPDTRSAIECVLGKEYVLITGEIKTKKHIDIESIVRKTLLSIDEDYKDYKVIIDVSQQSEEIRKKVEKGDKLGAGDQGLMYGYATNETKSYLPIPFVLATKIIKTYEEKLADKRDDYKFDSKAQVSYDYYREKLININLSVQHTKDNKLENIRKELKILIDEIIVEFEKENNLSNLVDDNTEFTINNAGTFIKGGAFADSGLTGRKIIADTYGGWGRHGGGAFSGKDYTKVDRSGAYYARYVARKIVEAGHCAIIEIQVSYIIGRSTPIAVNFETFDTEKGSTKEQRQRTFEKIQKYIKEFDFSLDNIIDELTLKKIDYTKTTLYGHFGKDVLPWK